MTTPRTFLKKCFRMQYALLSLTLALFWGALPGPAVGAGWRDEAKAMTVDSQGKTSMPLALPRPLTVPQTSPPSNMTPMAN